MATDPVCGMSVEPGAAAGTVDHGGSVYYFCSAHCKSRFESDPAKYLGGKAKAPEPPAGGNIYTCPMHPEVRQEGPGACPKCGMALEPESVSLPGTRASDSRSERRPRHESRPELRHGARIGRWLRPRLWGWAADGAAATGRATAWVRE